MTDEEKAKEPANRPAVERKTVLSMDRSEQRVTYFMAGIAGLLAIYVGYYLTKGKQVYSVTKDAVKGVCPTLKGYEHVVLSADHKTCTYTHTVTASALLIEFSIIVIAALVIAVATWKKKRSLVIISLFLVGVMLGPFAVGLPFCAVGGWLLWRAYRLQKYGDASFAGAGKAARNTPSPRTKKPRGASTQTAEPSRKPAEASKRYTPKKQVKKK